VAPVPLREQVRRRVEMAVGERLEL
jgi:hypothetical protein